MTAPSVAAKPAGAAPERPPAEPLPQPVQAFMRLVETSVENLVFLRRIEVIA